MEVESFFILHRGGEILFRWLANEGSEKQFLFSVFIKDHLLRKKNENQLSSYTPVSSSVSLSWITYEELELIFVVSNRKSLSVPYLHDLLVQLRCACVDVLLENSQSTSSFASVFNGIFDKIRLRFSSQRGTHKEKNVIDSPSSGVDKVTRNRLDFSSERSKGQLVPTYENDVENTTVSKEKYSSPNTWVTEMLQGKLAKKLTGKIKLSESDFKPIIEEFKLKLVNKNVAETIAENICKSASLQLSQNTVTSLSQVSKILEQVVVDNLVQILSPIRQVDVLREIQEMRSRNQVYVILFVGVNGVGKSTSLSKVAHWIQKNKLSTMIAACDTFRAGAVEQLRTHCQRLGIPLYERGYEKDPAVIAFEAVKQANRLKVDVLLIDTAGRMQDNEPLMRALSKLINLNKPNLTLFVGEALVGNEASEQLKTFNQRLLDLIDERQHTAVDGIILSKFDTVEDKIGAAISMVYSNNIPIIFLGCGQTYTDLRRFDVETFAKVLLN